MQSNRKTQVTFILHFHKLLFNYALLGVNLNYIHATCQCAHIDWCAAINII